MNQPFAAHQLRLTAEQVERALKLFAFRQAVENGEIPPRYEREPDFMANSRVHVAAKPLDPQTGLVSIQSVDITIG